MGPSENDSVKVGLVWTYSEVFTKFDMCRDK